MDQPPVANDVENEEINGVLRSVIARVHGLNAVLVSTSDGVPLVQVLADPKGDEAGTPEALAYFQTEMATTFAAASKQIASMKLGAVKSIVSEYRRFTIVHLDGGHLVITLVASSDANLALVMLLAPQLKKALSLLSEQIAY